MRSKYRAIKTKGYASRKEYKRSILLLKMQEDGTITNLQEQVKFTLIPTQYRDEVQHLKTKSKTIQKVAERAVQYIADFVYTDANGNQVVEDTKGIRTPDYIIKRKLMLWIHGIRVIEI